MSLTTRVLTGLALALVAGIAISLTDSTTLASIPDLIEPIGTLWVNAIRMTIVPLIIALLVTSIASEARRGMVARVGGRTIALFVVMTAGACLYTALAAPPLLAMLDLESAAPGTSDLAGAASAGIELPPFRDWLIGLVPTNMLRAAVDGAMLPLIVATALFAMALSRVDAERRAPLLGFFTGLKDAMFILIGWIMMLAPFGVFALVLPLAAKMGVTAAGAFGGFLAITCLLILGSLAMLYPIATIVGRVPISEFARAVFPAQAVGFGTRSSLASLPATLAASQVLRLPQAISSVVLPFAVSLFKFASPVGRASGTYFIAMLYGIELGVAEIAVVAATIGLLSFYSPGIPSGGLLIMTPLYESIGLPVEGIGILIALDLLVDMTITPANVTANLTAAVILTRDERNR